MNSNEKNQFQPSQTNSTEQSGTQNGESSNGAGKSSPLLIILILLILSIVTIFGYMVFTAMREDAIDESIAAEQLKAESERAGLTIDSEGNVITQDSILTAETLQVSDNVFFSKLAKSEPVSILIIGDVFGTGAGAKEGTNWTEVLVSNIMDTFGSIATINNLSLPSGNDAYSAYVTLMNESAGNPSAQYDAVIVSLGYYDDPFKFNFQYEGVLRSITERYPSAEIIGLIESASITAPDGYSDETAIYTRNLLEHYDGIVANMGEAFAVNGADPSVFTDDGLLPNGKGQLLYADWIVKQIKNKMSGKGSNKSSDAESPSELSKNGSLEPVNPDSAMYDHYYYITANSFLRLDDTNYIIGVRDLTALGAETEGLIGLDYDLVPGANTAQVVIDGSIFGALTEDHDGSSTDRHITAVKNNAIITDHIAVSFATKAEADTFHGLIITGNLNLSHAAAKYKKLPLPPETPAETAEETTVEETTVAETTEETAVPETAETTIETSAEETTVAKSAETSSEVSAEETTETSETKKSSDGNKKKAKKADSSNSSTKKSGASEEKATVAETTASAGTAVAESPKAPVPETTASGNDAAASIPAETTVPETAAPETSAETQNYFESVIISDPSNSAAIFETTAPYTVEAGQGIDINQWNLTGPTTG